MSREGDGQARSEGSIMEVPITGRTSLVPLGSVGAQGSGKDGYSMSHSQAIVALDLTRVLEPGHAQVWGLLKSSCTHGGYKVAGHVSISSLK